MTDSIGSVRLVHLADYGGPYGGSFVPAVSAVLRAARARGWRTEAVFGDVARDRPWLAELERAGVRVRFSHPRPAAAARRALEALVAEEPGPVILHTHFTGYDMPAGRLAGGRVHVVWHNHMGASTRPQTMLRNALKYSTIGRRVDRVLCVAPGQAEALRRRGAAKRQLSFFPNAINTGRFPLVSPEDRAAAREDLALRDDARVLLHFGWDWQRKGGDLLLAATRRLIDEGLPVVVLTVGGGEAGAQLAAALELGEAVRPLEPRDDVRALFAAADLFVSPSRAEGLTYSVAEALCSGIPVVASRIPGQEWIAPGQPALRLTDLGPAEIAAGARALLERDADQVERERLAGRQWVLENMDLERYAARVLALYDEVLSGTPLLAE